MSRLDSLFFLWQRRFVGEAGKPLPFKGIKAGCNVALRGKRGAS